MGIFKRDQPGSTSQPEGDGPVTLPDRTEPAGEGSPDTNQGKTEPMSPTPDHPEPAADLPTLADMSVGVTDPQSPSHVAAGSAHRGGDPGAPPRELSGPGAPPQDERPTVDTTTSTGGEQGPLRPAQSTTGTASRTPGSLGTVPEGEAVGTDVAAGAARTTPHGPGDRQGLSSGHGDPGPSPSAGDGPLEGSSEEQEIVTGTRTPDHP